MIRVVRSVIEDLSCEAILRSVSSTLEADTPFGREVEVRAGAGVSERLQAMGEVPVGAAVITPGGDLPVGFVIHVVLHSPEEPVTPERLRSALQNGLRRAEEWGLDTLALPPLGIGPGNLDAEEAAAVMVPLISRHLRNAESLREVQILTEEGYESEVFIRASASTNGDLRSSDG